MTPYNKKHVAGRLFLSQNYICFESRVSFVLFLSHKLKISGWILDQSSSYVGRTVKRRESGRKNGKQRDKSFTGQGDHLHHYK